MPRYTTNLSARGFRQLADDIRKYRLELQKKCDEFTRQLAEEGVAIAKANILSEDAIYTGELLNSMNIKPGDVIVNGASYHIYTACPWAKFVEFGTGIVGKDNPHPDISIVGWRYDVNEHGEKGWFYFKNGKWHWTKGMPSRPFMYNTASALRNTETITRIARRVFGED